MPRVDIPDEKWFEMNLFPEQGDEPLGFALPTLPPDEVQRNFTGKAGRDNLQQAFSFYKFIRENFLSASSPLVMDFGAGWGRIARFFLRDTIPQNLFAVDPLSQAVEWMHATKLPCRIIRSSPLPPIPGLNGAKFDLIYAFSVFSHLSEKYFLAWLDHLLSLLKDDGVMVFTTRGTSFLDYIERDAIKKEVFGDYSALRRRYQRGDFLFFRDRDDSQELSGGFFGEAFIPKQYLLRKLGPGLQEFNEAVPDVHQAVVVLRRTKPG